MCLSVCISIFPKKSVKNDLKVPRVKIGGCVLDWQFVALGFLWFSADFLEFSVDFLTGGEEQDSTSPGHEGVEQGDCEFKEKK